jgi:protoporphyrinogen/coproporphyrinogen III oxidase
LLSGSRKFLIVGGGISGLAAAYYLNKSGARPTLIEKSPTLGGVIQTETRDGCVLEAGPDSFLAAKPWALELIRKLGLDDEVIESNDRQRMVYVLRQGKLVPLPQGLMMMVPTRVWPMVRTPLLGWGTKIRMGMELWRRAKGARAERSVYEFLVDHYGEEANDYLAEPLLAGVYGGDPRELSATSVLPRFVELEAKYGSVTRGVLAAPSLKPGGSLFKTLKGGLAKLVDALAPSAEVVCGEVETIERANGGFRARVHGDWIEADQVVLATPAYRAAAILRQVSGRLAELLEGIPYSSSLTISLVYRKSDIGGELRGFGFLVPKRERRHVVACTLVHNKFPFRAPADRVVLRCFMGGASLSESDGALERIARDELQRILGIGTLPLFTNIARWPQSMPQYTVGHTQRVTQIEEEVRRVPGLHLVGNAYHGVGIPDCIRVARRILEPC